MLTLNLDLLLVYLWQTIQTERKQLTTSQQQHDKETRKAVNDIQAYLLEASDCLNITPDEVQKIKEAPNIHKR